MSHSLYAPDRVAKFLTEQAVKALGKDARVMPGDAASEYILYVPTRDPIRFRAFQLNDIIRRVRAAQDNQA